MCSNGAHEMLKTPAVLPRPLTLAQAALHSNLVSPHPPTPN